MYGSPTMQKLPFLFIYSWGVKTYTKKILNTESLQHKQNSKNIFRTFSVLFSKMLCKFAKNFHKTKLL